MDPESLALRLRSFGSVGSEVNSSFRANKLFQFGWLLEQTNNHGSQWPRNCRVNNFHWIMDPPDLTGSSPDEKDIQGTLNHLKSRTLTSERALRHSPNNHDPPKDLDFTMDLSALPKIPKEPREQPKKISKRQQPPAVLLELLSHPDRPSRTSPAAQPRKVLPGRMKGWLPPSPHNFEEASFKFSPSCTEVSSSISLTELGSYCLKSLGSKGLKCKGPSPLN